MLNSYSYEDRESLWKARWIASPIVYLSGSNSMLSIEYVLQRLQGAIRSWILLSASDLPGQEILGDDWQTMCPGGNG